MIEMLCFADFTEYPVVKNKDLDGKAFSVNSLHFLNIHLKATVTSNAIYRLFLLCNAGTNRKWKSTPHRSVTTTDMYAALIAFQNEGLRTPALMHTNINGYIWILGKQRRNLFNRHIPRLFIKRRKICFSLKALSFPIRIIWNVFFHNHSHEITCVSMILLLPFFDIPA